MDFFASTRVYVSIIHHIAKRHKSIMSEHIYILYQKKKGGNQ